MSKSSTVWKIILFLSSGDSNVL